VLVSPVVQRLFQRRLKQIEDIQNWVRRAQQAMKKGQPSAGVWEVVNGLKRTLSPPIKRYTYQALDSIQKDTFAGKQPTNLSAVMEHIGTREQPGQLVSLFADGRMLTPKERNAINSVREIDRIQKTEPERILTKSEIELLQDSLYVIEQGVAWRLDLADQYVETIAIGLGGDPTAVHRLFRSSEGRASSVGGDPTRGITGVNRTDQIDLYGMWERGAWADLLVWMEGRGYATGTRLDRPATYNIVHGLLETVIRLRAQEVWSGLLDDMVNYGISGKIDDIGEHFAAGPEREAFAKRVKFYLNQELKLGGGPRLEKTDPSTLPSGEVQQNYSVDFAHAFEPMESGPGGTKMQGAGPGFEPGIYSSRAKKRGGFRRLRERIGGNLSGQRADIDLEAYTVAHKLIEQWGMKLGANIEDWVLHRFPDGSTALVPKMLIDEIDAATERVAGIGQAFATGSEPIFGRATPSQKQVQDKAVYEAIPEILEPGRPYKAWKRARTEGKTKTEAAKIAAMHVKRKAGIGSAGAMRMTWALYPQAYKLLKMGLTTGIGGIIHLPYFMANGVGAQIQAMMKLGIPGYFSSMKHAPLAMSIAAKMWGDTPATSWRKIKPVVTPDGTVWTKEQLLREVQIQGLSSGFLAVETASSLSTDLRRNEHSFWKRVRRGDVPGGVRGFHQMLIDAATWMDNVNRVAIFIHQIGEGVHPAAAARAARSALFDYSDLTETEKKWMRQTFIFYSYQRKNLDLWWDTLLTNPHRIMMQFRLGRGLNEHFLDGDSMLIERDWTIGRVPVAFFNNAANRLVQSGRFNAPVLPGLEGLKAHIDFMQFIGSWRAAWEKDPRKKERMEQERFTFLGKLSPMVSTPLVLSFDKGLFGGRPLSPKRVPYGWVEWDYLTTGGSNIELFDIRPRGLKPWEREDYPGQTKVWETNEPGLWYLVNNSWHGAAPVLPGFTEESFLSKGEKVPLVGGIVDPIGEFVDKWTALGWTVRGAQSAYKNLQEGTLSAAVWGRAQDTLERFDRANVDWLDELQEWAWKKYKSDVESGRREPLNLSLEELAGLRFRYTDISDKTSLEYVTSYTHPITGEEFPIEGRGAAPRPGTNEWLAILFSYQEVPTVEAAIGRKWQDELRRLRRFIGDIEDRADQGEYGIENRPYPYEDY
jgi:hypothetical protein